MPYINLGDRSILSFWDYQGCHQSVELDNLHWLNAHWHRNYSQHIIERFHLWSPIARSYVWNNSLRLEHIQLFTDFTTEDIWHFSLFMEDCFSFFAKAHWLFDSWNTTISSKISGYPEIMSSMQSTLCTSDALEYTTFSESISWRLMPRWRIQIRPSNASYSSSTT
jgi:hypothetical protein